MKLNMRYGIAISLLQSALLVQGAFAQCENKSGFAKQVCQVQSATGAPGNPGLNPSPLDGFKGPALTTGFGDMIQLDTQPTTVEPLAFLPFTKLERTDAGPYILKAGIFEAYLQSYSLEPGDAGNNRVAGFYPAPFKGRRAKVIAATLKQVELHPDVPQGDIQQLLWAIVSGTDLEKMTPAVQQTAAKVLPHEDLAQLQGSVQAEAAKNTVLRILGQKIGKIPAIQQVVGTAGSIESVANPNAAAAGSAASVNAGSLGQLVVRGTWAQMPGGFFVRYLPEGASRIRVQVIVPDAAIAQADPKNPLVFDPTQLLAVYTQAPMLRLGVTMRPVK